MNPSSGNTDRAFPDRGVPDMVPNTESEAGQRLSVGTGAVRELPGRRFHEIVEEIAALAPRAIAVTADTDWTYAELNDRANRVAAALLAGGLPAESVVAVITERTLPWAASVLGVFKSGGVYLPIDADCPAAR